MASVFLKSIGIQFRNPLSKGKQHSSSMLMFVRENSSLNYINKSSLKFLSISNSKSNVPATNSTSATMLGGVAVTRRIHMDRALQDIFTIQDEKDFKAKVENSKKPVIVQFHATWCGPCKLLKPRLEKNLVKYADKVDLALVDIDELPEIAMKHNVGAVPAVMAIKNGQVFNKFVGLKDDDQIDKFLQESSK